jgi:hypothetical protein
MPELETRECEWAGCSNRFVASKMGRPRRWCSAACSTAATRDRREREIARIITGGDPTGQPYRGDRLPAWVYAMAEQVA